MNYLESTITAVKQSPTLLQSKGLSQTATGYGRKLLSTRMVQVNNVKRWLRVYFICFSNSGTAYVIQNGKPSYLSVDNEIQIYRLQEGC